MPTDVTFLVKCSKKFLLMAWRKSSLNVSYFTPFSSLRLTVSLKLISVNTEHNVSCNKIVRFFINFFGMEISKKMVTHYRSKSAAEKRKSWTERTHLLTAEKSLFRSLRGPTDSTDDTSITDRDDVLNGISMVSDGHAAHSGKSAKRTLGTFDGVFAPVSLSMLRKER